MGVTAATSQERTARCLAAKNRNSLKFALIDRRDLPITELTDEQLLAIAAGASKH
jgi:hypothetical protein